MVKDGQVQKVLSRRVAGFDVYSDIRGRVLFQRFVDIQLSGVPGSILCLGLQRGLARLCLRPCVREIPPGTALTSSLLQGEGSRFAPCQRYINHWSGEVPIKGHSVPFNTPILSL